MKSQNHSTQKQTSESPQEPAASTQPRELKIFERQLLMNCSNNFTFGPGATWIKCNGASHRWLAYGVQIMILLHLSSTDGQVSKIYGCLERELSKMMREQFANMGLGKRELEQEVLKGFAIEIGEAYQLQKLDKKVDSRLDKVCKIVNENRFVHETLIQFLHALLEADRSFNSAQEILGIYVKWEDYPNKLLFNKEWQCNFRFADNGEAEIKIQQYKQKEGQNVTCRKLLKKNTIQSIELSENEDSQDGFEKKQQGQDSFYRALMETEESLIEKDRNLNNKGLASSSPLEGRKRQKSCQMKILTQFEVSVKTEVLPRLMPTSQPIIEIPHNPIGVSPSRYKNNQIRSRGIVNLSPVRVNFRYHSPIRAERKH